MKSKKNLATKIVRGIALIAGTFSVGILMTAMIINMVSEKGTESATALYSLIGLCVSLILLVLCEISENIYNIAEKFENKDQVTKSAQMNTPVVEDSYRCPACGTINRLPSRYCCGCGKQIM